MDQALAGSQTLICPSRHRDHWRFKNHWVSGQAKVSGWGCLASKTSSTNRVSRSPQKATKRPLSAIQLIKLGKEKQANFFSSEHYVFSLWRAAWFLICYFICFADTLDETQNVPGSLPRPLAKTILKLPASAVLQESNQVTEVVSTAIYDCHLRESLVMPNLEYSTKMFATLGWRIQFHCLSHKVLDDTFTFFSVSFAKNWIFNLVGKATRLLPGELLLCPRINSHEQYFDEIFYLFLQCPL